MKKLTKMIILPCAALTIVAAGGTIVSFADSSSGITIQNSVASANDSQKKVATASDAWKYEIEGDEITITDYIGTDQEVEIPDEIDGKTVTKLNGGIFSGKTVTSVIMPDTITEIGYRLFSECKKLENVKLSSQIKEIPDSTFEYCSNLKEIELPEGLESFATSAFSGTGITELFIPKNVQTIDFGFLYDTMPAIEKYEVDSDNPYFISKDGMVLNKDGNELYLYPNGRIQEYDCVELPDYIETIKNIKELSPKKRCSYYYFYFGRNIKTIEGENSYLPVWADPDSKAYKYLNIQGYKKLYPITKENYEAMADSDFWFEFIDNESLRAYEYLGKDEVMNIPDSIGNLKITELDSGLLYDDVTTVVIPKYFEKFNTNAGSTGYWWALDENKKLYKIINNSKIDIPAKAYSDSFIGWGKENDNTEVLNIIPANSTVLRQYEIIFISRTIDTTNLPDHYAHNEEVILPTPKVKNGYVFKGWYLLDESGEEDKKEYITKIEGGTNRTMRIYAECVRNSSSSGGNSGSSGSSSGSHHSSSSSSSDDSDYGEPATSNKKSTSGTPVGLQITKSPFIMNSWEKVGNNWKFRMSDGSYAQSQWICSNGKWYLIGKDSIMLTGWQLVNSKWYLLGQDGALLTGWQLVNGKWYYLTADGSMLSATRTPDGYNVGTDGAWIQ